MLLYSNIMSPQLSSRESVVRGNSERVWKLFDINILVSLEHRSILFVLEIDLVFI